MLMGFDGCPVSPGRQPVCGVRRMRADAGGGAEKRRKMEKWRNGKPLPAGMGYVIAGASTSSCHPVRSKNRVTRFWGEARAHGVRLLSCPIPSRPVSSRPIPSHHFHPLLSYPIHPVPSHPIPPILFHPSHPIHLILFHPIPSFPSHPVPSIPSHPIIPTPPHPIPSSFPTDWLRSLERFRIFSIPPLSLFPAPTTHGCACVCPPASGC